MGAKNVKGLTIELGAETSSLEAALKRLGKSTGELDKELRAVEKGLKFDPGNTVLLAQKQDLLEGKIKNTRAALDALRQAQKRVDAMYKAGEIDAGQYRQFQRDVVTTESKLKTFEGQLKDVGQASDQAEKKTGKLGASLKNLFTIAGGVALAQGLIRGLGRVKDAITGTITASSDLSETLSKSRVVFGQSAKSVEKFGNTAAEALGMSTEQAVAAAAVYGNLFVSMKLGQRPAADMSKRLVQLAADLASFNNVDPTEALDALRSGLVGETEPLRRFGINLNDAELRQKALALGLTKTTTQVLPPAIKAQAAYTLIMEQSTTAQGDFARTADGLANSTRTLKGLIGDLKAKFGTALLPIIEAAIPRVKALVGWFSDLASSFTNTARTEGIGAAISNLVKGGVEGIADWIKGGGATTIGNAIGGVVKTAFTDMLPALLDAAGDLLEGVVKGLGKALFVEFGDEQEMKRITEKLQTQLEKNTQAGITGGLDRAVKDITGGKTKTLLEYLYGGGRYVTLSKAQAAADALWEAERAASEARLKSTDILAQQLDALDQAWVKTDQAVEGLLVDGQSVTEFMDTLNASMAPAADEIERLQAAYKDLGSAVAGVLSSNVNPAKIWEDAKGSLKRYNTELAKQLDAYATFDADMKELAKKVKGNKYAAEILAQAAKNGPAFVHALVGADQTTVQQTLDGLETLVSINTDPAAYLRIADPVGYQYATGVYDGAKRYGMATKIAQLAKLDLYDQGVISGHAWARGMVDGIGKIIVGTSSKSGKTVIIPHNIPAAAEGGTVVATGAAIIHQDERILTAKQTELWERLTDALARTASPISTTTNSSTQNVYNVTVDASRMPSADFEGLIASIQAATKMRGR